METPDGQERQNLNENWELSKINDRHKTTDFRSSKNIQQDKYWRKKIKLYLCISCQKAENKKENFGRSRCQREKNTLSTEEKRYELHWMAFQKLC